MIHNLGYITLAVYYISLNLFPEVKRDLYLRDFTGKQEKPMASSLCE